MDKTIRLLNYTDEPKEFVIKDFENVQALVFEIKSGDGVLTAIYPDHYEQFDADKNRFYDFNDGTWFISPTKIDVINEMKEHDDTDGLDEAMEEYESK